MLSSRRSTASRVRAAIPHAPCLAPLIVALSLAAPAAAAGATYSGRQNQLDVAIPRLEAPVTIDGRLDEPVWREAAVLTGLLAVRAVGRPPRRGRHDGAGLVLAHGHLLRHPRLRAARHGARDARRPRPHRRRRQRADLPRHVRRRAAGVHVRGQPARRAGRRRARRDGRAERARLQRARERARGGGPQPGLRVRVEGPAHRVRLRGRDPDPLQEPALPVARSAGLEPARHPRRAEHGARGQLGAGAARRGVVPGAGGTARRPHRTCAAAWCWT